MTIAARDRWFDNPVTGQRTRVVTLPCENGGRQFAFEYVFRPRGGRHALPRHVHPTAAETFEIVSGHAAYEFGGITGTAGPGERVLMPANVPHCHPWSDSDEPLHVRHTANADPPDERAMTASVQAVVTIFGLANAGLVNAKGEPGMLQLILLAHDTIPATYLANVPRPLQRMLFGVGAAIARARGLRTAYPQYGVVTDDGVMFDA